MKILVAYMSLSGNTKKIAQAIYGEIRVDKDIRELKDVDQLKDYDFAFIGFPMHGFGAPDEIKSFFQEKGSGLKVALFVTHGAPEDYQGLPPWLEVCRQAAVGVEVIDLFNCQGELAQYVADALLKSDNPRYQAYGRAGPTTVGQPDEQRIEWAKTFARKVMKKISP